MHPMHPAEPMHTCGRKTRGGYACKLRPMRGQTVCRMHGGSSPQALASAEERMRNLVHPALVSLARQIEHDEFQAVRYVLDYAGFKTAEKVSSDGKLVIEVEYVGGRTLEVEPHTNGHVLP